MEETIDPHPVDLHVGQQIRRRRKELRITQDGLAARLGLTFQQIQKYEKGANRVSASRLWEISHHLDVPVTFFFDGAPGGAGGDAETSGETPSAEALWAFLNSETGLEFAMAFLSLPPSISAQILDLMASIGPRLR